MAAVPQTLQTAAQLWAGSRGPHSPAHKQEPGESPLITALWPLDADQLHASCLLFEKNDIVSQPYLMTNGTTWELKTAMGGHGRHALVLLQRTSREPGRRQACSLHQQPSLPHSRRHMSQRAG